IDQPASLEVAVAVQVGSTLYKKLFHFLWLADEFPTDREERCGDTRHMWGRHARPTLLEVFKLGRLHIRRRLGARGTSGARKNLLAGREKIWFHPTVAGRSL